MWLQFIVVDFYVQINGVVEDIWVQFCYIVKIMVVQAVYDFNCSGFFLKGIIIVVFVIQLKSDLLCVILYGYIIGVFESILNIDLWSVLCLEQVEKQVQDCY